MEKEKGKLKKEPQKGKDKGKQRMVEQHISEDSSDGDFVDEENEDSSEEESEEDEDQDASEDVNEDEVLELFKEAEDAGSTEYITGLRSGTEKRLAPSQNTSEQYQGSSSSSKRLKK